MAVIAKESTKLSLSEKLSSTRRGRCRGVPRVRHAGRLHHAGSRLLPLARDRQRADGVRGRYLPLRHSLLRDRLCVHVQSRQRFHRLSLVLPARARRQLMKQRASRSWQSGSSSSPLPIPARPSPRAHDRPHWVRRRLALQRRRLGLHLSDHRPLGLGAGRFLATMGSAGNFLPPSERASTISRAPRWCTPSAASLRWPVPSFSVRAWDASSSATAADPCCRTI
jgi:hypothetical protein